MNHAELRTEAGDIANLHPTDPVMSPQSVARSLNRALRRYTREREWGWLVTETTIATIPGASEHDLPANHLKTLDLAPSADGVDPLVLRSAGALDRRWTRPLTVGAPVEYAVVADSLRLRPVPDGVYLIVHRYKQAETVLELDDDEPLLPETYQDLVVAFAAADLLRQARDPRFAELEAEARMILRQMADDEDRSNGPKKKRTRDRYL